MKILHVISSMNPENGGVCKAVRDFILGMKYLPNASLYTNEVVCLDSANDDFLADDDFKIIALGDKKTSWSYSAHLYPWLAEKSKDYSVIVVHGLWQYQSLAMNNLFKKIGAKYYVMPHGMLDPYFQKAKGRKLKALRNSVIWSVIEKRLIKNAKGLLFTCEEEKLLATASFTGYKPKKETVVGLGVELPPEHTPSMDDAFKAKVPLWNGRPFLLFLSRINEKKGVDLLIKAYVKLESERNDLPQLVIAGPGLDTPYGANLINLVKGSAKIIFPGMLSGDPKWGAFYNCEAFVLSSHQENFGIAIAEALACKKPVLITNKINIWREIQGGDAGLVSNDTEDSIYNQLKTWFGYSEQERAVKASNAYHTFEHHFYLKNSAEKLLTELKDS